MGTVWEIGGDRPNYDDQDIYVCMLIRGTDKIGRDLRGNLLCGEIIISPVSVIILYTTLSFWLKNGSLTSFKGSLEV
jgi:hypothetical protein